MDSTYVVNLGREAMQAALMLLGPALGAALAVGLLTGILQAVTSIRDMTMGLILKIVAISVTLLLCGNWMIQVAVRFSRDVFEQMSRLGH